MKDLSQIALWATVGRPDPAYLLRVMRVFRYCNAHAKFDDSVLFTVIEPPNDFDWNTDADGAIRVLQIPEFTKVQWEIFINKTVPSELAAYERHMAIHEDGFPIEWDLWENVFSYYDWVGAPWHDGVVGSGGCALTSYHLMQQLLYLPFSDGMRNADEWVCRSYKEPLEAKGITFAPSPIAARYCTETTFNDRKSFAFHGRRHCPEKYAQGWRQIEEWEKSQGL